MEAPDFKVMFAQFAKQIQYYEDLRKFNTLKRIADCLIQGGYENHTEKEKDTYNTVLDELSYIYYSFDEEKRKRLRIENNGMCELFDVFDKQEHVRCSSNFCKEDQAKQK